MCAQFARALQAESSGKTRGRLGKTRGRLGGERSVVGMTTPPIHPDIAPIAFLLGTWSGEGNGNFPTIEPFAYHESVEITHNGKPFLAYRQRTMHATENRPLHAESGYWRLAADGGAVELVLAHPFGLVEVLGGPIVSTTSEHSGAQHRFDLVSTAIAGTATAKEVRATRRTIDVGRDVLTYDVAMEAVGVPLTHHLHAVLHREGAANPSR